MDGDAVDEPEIGRPLPNAERAIIPREKLEDYCLDPDHSDGGPKAVRFQRELGLGREDWAFVRDQIRKRLPHEPVVGRKDRHGWTSWRVDMCLRGRSGKRAPMLTGWTISDQRFPQLVTAYLISPERWLR